VTLVRGTDVEIGAGVEIGEHVVLHDDVWIGDGCVIEDGAVLGKRPFAEGVPAPGPLVIEVGTYVGSHAVVFGGVRLGEGVRLEARSQVRDGTTVGAGTVVGAGAAIGFEATLGARVLIGPGAWITSRSLVEDDVEVGAAVVTTNDDTMARLGGGGLTGPVLRRGCRIGDCVVLTPGIEVGAGATVRTGAVVSRNVAPGATVAGVPARPQ
jgi:UDP-3-O-[3-hydroxymyristoyl] glucosamine N-acyltransferase